MLGSGQQQTQTFAELETLHLGLGNPIPISKIELCGYECPSSTRIPYTVYCDSTWGEYNAGAWALQQDTVQAGWELGSHNVR